MNLFSLFKPRNETITLLDRLVVEENIKHLNHLLKQNETFDDVKKGVEKLLKGYQNRSVRFPIGGSLFRAIPYAQKPDRFEKLTYPPKEIARENRENRDGVQVLYCSTSKGAPIFEIRPNVGQYVALVEYRIEKTLEVAHVGFTLKSLSAMREEREPPFWCDGNDWNCNRFLENFVRQIFCCLTVTLLFGRE